MNAMDKATNVIQNMSLAGFGLSVHLFSQGFEEEDWVVVATALLISAGWGWGRKRRQRLTVLEWRPTDDPSS
jgi:hypothetical protein